MSDNHIDPDAAVEVFLLAPADGAARDGNGSGPTMAGAATSDAGP
jgi:hypothetical protein